MASLAASAGAAKRRLAPPALTESLVDCYQMPESFPDTPEPWSAMAGAANSLAAPKAPSPDFGLAQPHRESAQARPMTPSRLRGELRFPPAVSKPKSKLLTVRNTFIDVGLPSPMEQLRQAHSCPGSRLVTPQSCRSGRLLSPLHDASVESSAVSTVDTEEAAQPKELPLSCFEQALETPPPTSSFGVHRLQTYDLPQHNIYEPALYDAPPQFYGGSAELPPAVAHQQPAYHPAPMGYAEAPQQRMAYDMPPQPFQRQQQQAPFRWSEAPYESAVPQQPQQPHPACSSRGGMMPWGSEPLPTLLTGQGLNNMGPPAPAKPILQLDKALPVTQPADAAPGLGSPEVPTIGSAGHGLGECKPCAFYWKPQGCGNGVNCVFCHLCDSGEKKRRAKEKRVAMRMAKATGIYM